MGDRSTSSLWGGGNRSPAPRVSPVVAFSEDLKLAHPKTLIVSNPLPLTHTDHNNSSTNLHVSEWVSPAGDSLTHHSAIQHVFIKIAHTGLNPRLGNELQLQRMKSNYINCLPVDEASSFFFLYWDSPTALHNCFRPMRQTATYCRPPSERLVKRDASCQRELESSGGKEGATLSVLSVLNLIKEPGSAAARIYGTWSASSSHANTSWNQFRLPCENF